MPVQPGALAQKTPSSEAPSPGFGGAGRSLAFLGRAAFWVVLLFGITRIPWVQHHLLLPFAAFQGRIGCGLFRTPVNSVFVGLSCTGADPMALVVGAILAFPVAWSRRIKACFGGLALILVLNTIRIGTLSLVVDESELFNLLHYYLWPALLIAVAAGYIFFWMAKALRAPTEAGDTTENLHAIDGGFSPAREKPWRFVGLLVVLVGLFYLVSGWLFRSAAILEVAGWAAAVAAAVMAVFGVSVEVAGNTLRTSSGAFVVTQSCVVTPLLPVYLAAVLSLSMSPVQRTLAALAALPLFVFLGTARLLVLALPLALVGSHSIAIHAFYQVLVAILVIVWVRRGASARALAVGTVSAFLVGLVGKGLSMVLADWRASVHLGHGYIDPQGALSLMPAFQIGLFVALWLASSRRFLDRRLGAGVALLLLAHACVLVVLGELAVHVGIEAPIAAIRAASLGLPLLLAWWLGGRSEGAENVAPEPLPQSG